VLIDDRELRAGEKFADADLIGIPVRVTVGKRTLDDGMVDVRSRAAGSERRVALEELSKEVLEHGKTT
jgi:prolyl-tRNA synthetase